MSGFGGAIDSATWQALGVVLTVLGLGLSAVVWTRRGAAKGLRAVAWSLIPLAAGLTGVLRLGWEITDSVLRWAARLVFSPLVWLGLVVAAVSLVLFVVSGWLIRRGGGQERRSRTQSALGGGRTGARSAGAEPSTRAIRSDAGDAGDAGDMADVEEILRRHGIQ